MARRKKQEEHVNHERWLVSYADFITLLFAFFVVMYSISSVNEGKYRVLSDTMSSAFDPSRAGLPIQLDSPLKPPIVERSITTSRRTPISMHSAYPSIQSGVQASEKDKKDLRTIATRAEQGLSRLIDKDIIKLKKNDLWIEIEIKSSILFPSGGANLAAAARPVLRKISKIVKTYKNQIQVEGFTDNLPIETDVFPSNWELSAARAASVVHLFSKAGVDPKRLSAVGYGEYKPISSNSTALGRSKNRRINIIILSDAIARRTNRNEQLDETVAARRKAISKPQPSFSGNAPPINLLPPVRQ